MNRKPAKRSSLFLMELIIAILFFCLSSAVCVRFFVKSHLIEKETEALNHAVNYASSVAEIIRSSDDLPAGLKDQFPDGSFRNEESFLIFFDSEWKTCHEDDARWLLVLDYGQTSDFLSGEITVSSAEDTEAIYTMEVKKYLQKEAVY